MLYIYIYTPFYSQFISGYNMYQFIVYSLEFMVCLHFHLAYSNSIRESMFSLMLLNTFTNF